MNEKKYTFDNEQNSELKKQIVKYLVFWPHFLISLIIFLIVAFTYLRYANYVYRTTSKIEIIDKAQDSEMALPTSMTIFNRSMINVSNEIGVLSSYSLHRLVSEQLKSNIKFFRKGNIKDSEVHISKFNNFFDIEFINPKSLLKINHRLKIDYTNGELKYTRFQNDVNTLLSTQNKTTQGKIIIDSLYKLNPNFDFDNSDDFSFIISIVPLESIVGNNMRRLTYELEKKDSDQITISMLHPNRLIAEDYINELMLQFNQDGVKDRQGEYKRTMDFVDNRSIILEKELKIIEKNKEEFKVDKQLTDIKSDAEISISQKVSYNSELFDMRSQVDLANLLKETINEKTFTLLPINIGIENNDLNQMIIDFNSLIRKRDNLLLSAGINNSIIKTLDNQISSYYNNLNRSIENYIDVLSLNITNLSKKESEYTSAYLSIPENERILRSIERELEVKESLFLLLLQKREEAAINFAVIKPSIKIIDYAKSSKFHVSPNSSIIYITAIVLGLTIPFVIISLILFFDNKIYTRDDVLESVPNAPILTEIPFIKNYDHKQQNDLRDTINESIRMLLSNINMSIFETNKNSNLGKVITVTSSVKGEGKTLVAYKTAELLAKRNEKVLLIGCDLRNPQIHKLINRSKDEKGVTEYISRNDISYDDIIIKDDKLDIILSGAIPPNPALILTSSKFVKMIDEVKKIYDYIIIDTAPCLLVADTFDIYDIADLSLYIVRSGHTDKKICQFINELVSNKRLKNISIVLNGVGVGGPGYKYAYQYGYSYVYKYAYQYNYGYSYGYKSD